MNEKSSKDNVIKRLPAEIGNHLKDINLEKAMVYLDEAVETIPEERYCLLSRAEARMRALDVSGATRDIEILLNLYPYDLTAHALNNDIEYMNLNFEKALILNDKYLKQRKNPPYFSLGYMKCMDAVLNSLTKERAGHPLRDHYRIIRKTAWDNNRRLASKLERDHIKKRKTLGKDSMKELADTSKNMSNKSVNTDSTFEGLGVNSLADTTVMISKTDVSINTSILESWKNDGSTTMIPKLVNFPYRPLQRRTSNLANYMAEKYLGQIHRHKCFFQQIPKRKGFIAPNQKAEQKLKKLVNNIITYLNKVQNLMRSKRPFYHIKYQEGKISNAENRKESLFRREKEEAQLYFTKILHRLYDAYLLKDLKGIMGLVSNMVDYFHGRFPRSITRDEYSRIAESFNVLRDGYFYFGLFTENMTTKEKITRTKVRLGMAFERRPSTDSFFNNLRQYNSINWAPRIKVIEERLKKAQFLEEVIYFHFELARLNLELGKVELVRRHAKKCIAVARECKDMKWVINTGFLLIKASMKQHNKMDALKVLERALVVSKTMSCPELVTFLDFAINLVQETDFNILSGPTNRIKSRKKQILNLLDDERGNKRKAETIFRKLSVTPTERTMSLLPGVKLSLPAARKRTVVEEKPTVPYRTVASRVSREAKMANNRRGSEFYQLVKDYVEDERF